MGMPALTASNWPRRKSLTKPGLNISQCQFRASLVEQGKRFHWSSGRQRPAHYRACNQLAEASRVMALLDKIFLWAAVFEKSPFRLIKRVCMTMECYTTFIQRLCDSKDRLFNTWE